MSKFKGKMAALLAAAVMMCGSSAKAEESYHPVGVQLDLGAPDGAAAGVVVRPLAWMRVGGSATYNGLAPGGRIGLTIDPANYWLSPTLTVEGGAAFSGRVPHLNNSPDINDEYCNLHLGLDFGAHNSVRFFIHAGPSFIKTNVSNIGPIVGADSSFTFSNPHASAVVLPTAKFGFVFLF
jgi:hypothetical protein